MSENLIATKNKRESAWDEVESLLKELFNEEIEVESEQMAAAYALNMCTMSISQIVEYQDLNIMEQEYDNILNNLNLENIAKDEVLLDLIKQILNVITFFRISDGDRKMIEKKYQQKMKNAIWSSIPSPSVLLGAGPAGIALSIVSMVGTGYMNYRKAKAEGNLEMKEEKWKLQRSAIDQLNGLRRELFNAAWKFAEKYEYPDRFRITERQIKQFNEILMDSNLIRKYYRLLSVQKNFIAYPDYWYYFAHTMNEIYRMSDGKLFDGDRIKSCYSELEINVLERTLTDDDRETYKNDAKKYFKIYMKLNKVSPLLRENHVASTCALEYVDLLFDDNETDEIEGYIDDAVSFSGNSNDILQLCAIAYLRINKKEKAVDLLNILINEEYNIEMNAQLLSGVYISLFNEYEANTEKAIEYKANYNLLVCRIGAKNQAYIMPWPEGKDGDSSQRFINKQKEQLIKKTQRALEEYREIYAQELGSIIPMPYSKGRNKSIADRDYMRMIFDNSRTREEYRNAIYSSAFITEYCLVADKMVGEMCSIKYLTSNIQDKAREIVEDCIYKRKEDFLKIQASLQENSYNLSDYDTMIMLTDAHSLTNQGRFFDDLYSFIGKEVEAIVRETTDMAKIMAISNDIDKFCENVLGHSVVVEFEETEIMPVSAMTKKRLGSKSFDENITNQIADRIKGNRMLRLLQSADVSSLEKSRTLRILLRGTQEFEEYFCKGGFVGEKKANCFAVIDDLTKSNRDMLLTADGVMRCGDKNFIGFNEYSECAEKKKLSDILPKKALSDEELEKLADIFSKLSMMPFEE